MDLQLKEFQEASSQITLAEMPVDPASPLTAEFISDSQFALSHFVNQLRKALESPETAASPIRRFIRSIPREVTIQDSIIRQNGTVFSVGPFEFSEKEQATQKQPHIKTVTGVIHSMKYIPDSESIKIQDENGEIHHCRASTKQCERAIEFRKGVVKARILVNEKGSRLISIMPGNQTQPAPSLEERKTHIFRKWKAVLQRLAE